MQQDLQRNPGKIDHLTPYRAINFCEACKHQKKTAQGPLCQRDGLPPNFDDSCDHFQLKEGINLHAIKTTLEKKLMHKANYGGDSGRYFPLLDLAYSGNEDISDPNGQVSLDHKGVFKITRIVLVGFPIAVLSGLIFRNEEGFQVEWLFLLLASLSLFFLTRKELKSKDRNSVNRQGLILDQTVYSWKAIEGVYFLGSDEYNSEIIILLQSGIKYHHDVHDVTYISTNRLKRLINSYRRIGINDLY